MPCGRRSLVDTPCAKKPLVKNWDKPKDLKVVKPSRYQKNEASVKVHWKNVITELESSYKDEQFWDTQSKTVLGLVGPVIFERLVKIFDLQIDEEPYVPASEPSSVQSSDQFYITSALPKGQFTRTSYSLSDFEPEEVENEEDRGTADTWSNSSTHDSDDDSPMVLKSKTHSIRSGGSHSASQSVSRSFSRSASRSVNRSVSRSVNRSVNRSMKSVNHLNRALNASLMKSFSKVFNTMSRTFNKSFQMSSRQLDEASSWDETATSEDDMLVHAPGRRRGHHRHKVINPHFEMLYCHDSETDMITWKSNYKAKKYEVTESDEYSKKAERLTKEIATEFCEWWNSLGSGEFNSEIQSPDDIEDLFQVWFDEHASRGVLLDPKVLPCVLQNIANYVGAPGTSCAKMLKRQIAKDINAESKPPHTLAFGENLPLNQKHIPPQNNTKEKWRAVNIPEDLRSMAAVWEDISHLTSTKSFMKWLSQHPYMPMPPYLKELVSAGDKKQLFVIPSDFVVRRKSIGAFSKQDLNIPVSQFSLEIKEVLSRLMDD